MVGNSRVQHTLDTTKRRAALGRRKERRTPRHDHGYSGRAARATGENRERNERCKQALGETLDLGSEDSFPGSDAVAVTQPRPCAHDKREP